MFRRATVGARRGRAFLSWLFRGHRLVVALGCVLVCFDLGFVLLHIAASLWFPGNSMLYVDVDQGYAEIFQGVKYVVAALLVCGAATAKRLWALMLWVPVFALLFVDDLFRGHERAGSYVHRELLPGMGDVAQDVGEVGAFLLGAVVVGAVLRVGYVRGSSTVRWVYRVMVTLLVLLALFAGGVDLLHALAPEHSVLADSLALVEDGGEMLVISGFAVVAARLLGPLPVREGG